ncbi:MAG: DNA-3-methyladenine glycosylase [Ignavibacteria bacterium]|jgi:DNA-3-methyladenine glycosylase|nr:DNA-3-methyladenine glycosylase [Ignavibacteria bacterium]MDH7526647.1 DNA-3-methyladenine glycosylase [Ignavibacteria bacterium]
MNYQRVNPDFFKGPTEKVAKKLLGKILVRVIKGKILSGKIVETEAYLDENDLASHSAVGMTERNKVMFGEAGLAYVYFTYGMHYCFNVVTGEKGKGSAVLIRAIEPIEGIDLMKKFRRKEDLNILTNGPAKLCQALNIDKRLNGVDLKSSNEIFIAEPFNKENFEIVVSKRIGIEKSKDLPLRFYIKENKFVSKK